MTVKDAVNSPRARKAAKNTVAGTPVDSEVLTPETVQHSVSELEAADAVTTSLEGDGLTPPSSGVVAAEKVANLVKARAAKAAKAAARKAAAEQIEDIQSILAAEHKNDKISFGEIRRVVPTLPTREEYVKILIPATDLFDHTHPGVQLNRHKFEPGQTYHVRGDVALEVQRRLALFHDEQVRLLRPNADRKALADVNRGSSWTSRGAGNVVPLANLEDLGGDDTKIFTVDF